MNTIAVDAMGGDSAPGEIVKGAIKAKNPWHRCHSLWRRKPHKSIFGRF